MRFRAIITRFRCQSLCSAGLLLISLFTSAPSPVLLKASSDSNSTNPQTSDTAAVVAELQRAASLLRLGKAAEAEPILNRVILAAPQNPDAHNLLGTILDQRGEFKEAEKEYREALRLNPNLLGPLANLGVLLARTARSQE